MWQLLAIVAISAGTLLWFIRDERARKEQLLRSKAHYFAALRPARAMLPNLPAMTPDAPRRAGGLLDADRAFFNQIIREKETG